MVGMAYVTFLPSNTSFIWSNSSPGSYDASPFMSFFRASQSSRILSVQGDVRSAAGTAVQQGQCIFVDIGRYQPGTRDWDPITVTAGVHAKVSWDRLQLNRVDHRVLFVLPLLKTQAAHA